MKNIRPYVTIGIIVLATLGLLFGLAKLGTSLNGTNQTQTQLTTPVDSTEHIRGPIDAPITLVEYSDFQCPSCATLEPTLKKLGLEFSKELRVVYRHYPLRSLHPNAEMAAWASEAAHLQGKFWEYHDMLFNTQDAWANEKNPQAKFVEYAKSLSLDTERFTKDLTSSEVKNSVAQDANSGDDNNVSGTPTLFLNGQKIEIPSSYDGFKAAIIEQIIITGNNVVTPTTK